jgi:hypothetical protein
MEACKPVYKYPYGSKFNFINLGKITVIEDPPNFYEYCVVYDMQEKHIKKLIPIIFESCQIIDSIDNYDLSKILYDCLDFNLGCIFGNIYFKHYEQCRQKLIEYLSPLIRETWSIEEVKEERIIQILEKRNTDIVYMLDAILDSLLAKEADSRFRNRKARYIQDIWKQAISNPYHPCCQRRLMREATELV